MKNGPDNPVLQRLVVAFEKQYKKTKAALWKRLAQLVLAPVRKKEGVNLGKISRYCKDGDVVAVPAKVLSIGELKAKVAIYSLGASSAAKQKIEMAGSTIQPLSKLAEANIAPAKVRIII